MDQQIKKVTPIYKDLLVPVRKNKKSISGAPNGVKKGCGKNENLE